MKKRIAYLMRDELAEENPRTEELNDEEITDVDGTGRDGLKQYEVGPVYVKPEKYGKEGAAALNKLHDNLHEKITDIDDPEK